MKHFFIVLSFLICTMKVHAQSYIFILVDVSMSISQPQLADAKQELFQVLTGSSLIKAFISQGQQADMINFKLTQGDKLSIVKFGNLQTTLSIDPNPITVQNIQTDLNLALNNFQWIPSDLQTYYILAKAKIAEYAKNHQITQFKLFIISDNIQDDFGPNGKPNYPNEYIRNLAEGYNTRNNQVNEAGYTIIKFASSSDFKLSFSPDVDVSKYNPPTNPIPPNNSDNASLIIELTSFKGGTSKKPFVVTQNKFTISWFCKNAPINALYKIRLSPVNNSGERTQTFTTASNSYNLQNISDGKWKIIVSSGDSNFNATSATTTIEVKTRSSSLFLWLIFLTALIAGGYWYWKKKQEDKLKKLNALSKSDNFSKGSTINTNSEYF